MADWYVSSAAYAAISAFVPSAVYSVGNIVKPTAPVLKAQWVFRCTVAGTASTEPVWTTANNSTIATGGATFTNVTGQSTYGWSAAAGDLQTLMATGSPRFVAGERVFVSSDHSETQTTSSTYGSGANAPVSYSLGQILSVNRAGSVPPVAGDLTAGASCTSTANIIFELGFPVYHYGINFITTGGQIYVGSSYAKTIYLDTCQLYLNSAGSIKIQNQTGSTLALYNSTLRFGTNGSQSVTQSTGAFEIIWLNTPSAIVAGTPPNFLFTPAVNAAMLVTIRGVDLSAVTNTLVNNSGASAGSKFLFDSCRIASGVTRYNVSSVINTRDLVELINCYDGTSILNESYQPAGVVTTERTITLSAGATDDVGTFSHKLVSNTNIDKYVNPLLGFWMDVGNAAVGSSKTATVEIISSVTLNNDDISLLLEYQGTAGSSVGSFVNSLPATVLTANAAVTVSTATWNSQPATPQKQKLVVTFTPQLIGRVRGQVRLGAVSTTVYVNPVITIT